MNKSILMSIQPQWTAKILNGEKTIEVRKKFPKDFRGWVYIYCTKGKQKLNYHSPTQIILGKTDLTSYILNGKVVARFWCDNVEEIRFVGCTCETNSLDEIDLGKKACLLFSEIYYYLKGKTGRAIHISQLEIFDKPKELWEFRTIKKCNKCSYKNVCCESELKERPYIIDNCNKLNALTRSPQSWMYIDMGE